MKARTPNTKLEGTSETELPSSTEERSPLTPTDAVDEAEIRKIEELLADSELAGGSIRLERKGPGDSSYQYCTKIRVSDGLDLDLIKRVWGGGDYKARTFRSNGQTYKQFAFSIDYRIKGSMDMSDNGKRDDDGKTMLQIAQMMKPDASQNTLFLKMMEQSQSSSDKMMQMMMLMMQNNQQQQAAMMTAMATAFGGQRQQGSDIAVLIPVLTAMINKPMPTAEKGNLLELVTAMKELKELTAPGSVSTPEKEEEKETVLDKIIKYGGPVVAALITRQPIQMPGAAPAAEVPQLPAPGGSAIELQPAGQPMSQGLPPEFKMYVNMIIGAAQKNADTGTYADLVADNLDDQQAEILCGILQQPDWVEKLAQTDQRVLQFVPWFTKLRGELLEIYGVSQQPDSANEGPDAPPAADIAGGAPANGAPVITIPGASTGRAGQPA